MSRELFIRNDCSYDFLSHLETVIPEEDLVFRKHVKVVALALQGYPIQRIATTANYSAQHVSRILNDYNKMGFFALLDRRRMRKYSEQDLQRLFHLTASQLGFYLNQETVRGWLSPATHLLNPVESQQQLQPATSTVYSQPTYSYYAAKLSDRRVDTIKAVGVLILFLLFFGAVHNVVSPQHQRISPNNQGISIEPHQR
jgi:hypothetical protein